MPRDVDFLYRQHLTATDRQLLATAEGGLLEVLASAALEEALFGTAQDRADEHGTRVAGGQQSRQLVAVSPFLTFAVAVHRSAARLEAASFVEERLGSRHRIPVFDVAPLRQLLSDPALSYFLVELLASYTHVTSGATWEKTTRGWRRRRFSELDPVRLAGLLETVDESERPGVYRRLGDLALFLTGVFPDARSLFELGPVSTERLLRLSGARRGRASDDPPDGRTLLEMLGGRWYRQAVAAARTIGAPHTDALGAVEQMAERFDHARRALNVVTDWYLFPFRNRWFGVATS